jgi:hypothetical protein
MNGQKKKTTEEMRKAIQAALGILKYKSGEKPFVEQWAEHKREEMELETAKFIRMTRAGVSPTIQRS